MNNIPVVKLGLIAVSRDCFPIQLSEKRRAAIKETYKGELYECPVTVENEKDMEKALEDVNKAECNALVVFLGNFGPETPETLIAERFDGPCMYVAAAEGDGDMINGRGDAYCGMLNCSYNLKMRHLKAYIPEYPVGTADDIAKMIADFVPVARAVIGVSNLKIITFGPRPQDFFACNAPIKYCADAFCIAGNLKALRRGDFLFQQQTRKHNRQIHKCSILKGGVRKLNQAPFLVKGFRLFDKVRIGGQIGFVFGRRVRGTFNIRRLDKTVIGTDINCKKLSLLETRKTFLTELRKE